MGGIERFEDIEAWKVARELTKQVYAVTQQGPFGKDYGLRDQIQRAASSIMANIAEGFDGGSHRECLKFLGYALRSASEVQSHLYVAFDQGSLDQHAFPSLSDLTLHVKKLISGFRRSLRSRSPTLHVQP